MPSLAVVLCLIGLINGLPMEMPPKITDLTHPFGENYTISWPTAKKYDFTIVSRGFNEALDSWYEGNNFAQAEHCGTHTDAPSHFSKGKWRLGDYSIGETRWTWSGHRYL